jgi:large subunit ribosomal protein L18
MASKSGKIRRVIRHKRLRKKLRGTDEKPRLSVYRSLGNIYAQVINDQAGHTIVSASSLEEVIQDGFIATGGKIKTAEEVGRVVAQRAIKNGVKQVVFDRGGYKFHGRVKAVADAAKKEGLIF